MCSWKKRQKDIEIEGKEKMSFVNFLGGQQSKIVGLEKVLGIGGEGVVIQEELEIKLMEGTEFYVRAENIRLKSKDKKKVALKFVKFERNDGENLEDLREGQGCAIHINSRVL